MAATVLQAGNTNGLSLTQGATVYAFPGVSRFNQNSTEANQQRTFRAAGTASQLWVRISANGVSATSTVRTRLNGANGGQSLTINSGATGEFTDSSNSDSIAAGDEFNFQTVVGAGGTTLTVTIMSVIFAASSNTYCTLASSTSMVSPSTATTYYHWPAGSSTVLSTTEANQQVKMKSSGTLKHFFLAVSVNDFTSNTLFRSRINAANGNLLVTVTASTTGVFEDTSNSDTFVADDLICYSATTGATGTGSILSSGGAAIETTNDTFTAMGATVTAGVTVNASLTRYMVAMGEENASSTETPTQGQINAAYTASKLEIYVSANTVSATSTLKLRKNGADGTQSVSITANTTGWFEDASGSDSISSGDEINYALTTGGTGTSLTFMTTAMLMTIAGGAPGGSSPPGGRFMLLGIN